MSNAIVSRWCQRVRKYNERNAGRFVNLELIRDDLSALPEAKRLVLTGVDYDDKADRADIMLASGSEHLSHSIDHVKSIYMLIPSDDGGDVLAIEHQGGRTILTAVQAPVCAITCDV